MGRRALSRRPGQPDQRRRSRSQVPDVCRGRDHRRRPGQAARSGLGRRRPAADRDARRAARLRHHAGSPAAAQRRAVRRPGAEKQRRRANRTRPLRSREAHSSISGRETMRHLAIATAVATSLSAWSAGGAAAQAPVDYPHKVVTLVTHSSPGGGSDVFLREMAKHLPKYIKATFIIENVQGGSGARAVSRLATAPADGSVFYATTPTYIYTSLLSKTQHGYKDVEPLANFFTDSEVIYTRADGPYKTLKDVIDKAQSSRGRWGAANPASLERQAAEQLKKAAGVSPAVVS